MKNKHGGEKPHIFSQNTHYQFIESVPLIFETIAVFKLILNHMKNKHGGEKPHISSQNTHYQFIESVPM